MNQVHAQVNLIDSLLQNQSPGLQNLATSTNPITDYISSVLPTAYAIAGLILFILIVAGGFAFISAGDNPEKAQQGKKTITAAIIGFAVIFTSFWIIQIIEIITGLDIV